MTKITVFPYQAGAANYATKNEIAKITDYIWLVIHMDVQGWKERRREQYNIVLEGTEKQLKRESHSQQKEEHTHHDFKGAGDTLPNMNNSR